MADITGTDGKPLGLLHGLQIATLDTAALALGTAVFAALALPRRTVTGIAVRSGAARAVKAGGGHKRWIR